MYRYRVGKNLPGPVSLPPDNDDAGDHRLGHNASNDDNHDDHDHHNDEGVGVGVEEKGSEDLSQRSRRSGVEVSAGGATPWTEKDVRNYRKGVEEKGVGETRFVRVQETYEKP